MTLINNYFITIVTIIYTD